MMEWAKVSGNMMHVIMIMMIIVDEDDGDRDGDDDDGNVDDDVYNHVFVLRY